VSAPSDSNPAGLPSPHWSLRVRGSGAAWLITAKYGKGAFWAEGETRAEAWRRLCEQINRAGLLPPPSISLIRARREWREHVMACAGALLGWLAPLLVKHSVPGAGVALYECVEDVLCPLFAFVGGGIGITCGGAWAAIRQRGAIRP
jgi:hypothetical protein